MCDVTKTGKIFLKDLKRVVMELGDCMTDEGLRKEILVHMIDVVED